MAELCDACLRPVGAHLPSEIDDCDAYDPGLCEGCQKNLPQGLGDPLCIDCRATVDQGPQNCTFLDPHAPGLVRRLVNGKFEWVVP